MCNSSGVETPIIAQTYDAYTIQHPTDNFGTVTETILTASAYYF